MNEKTNASVAALAHALGPGPGVEPPMATDQGDRRAEEVALEDPGEAGRAPRRTPASDTSSANESTPITCVLTTAPPITPMKSAIRVSSGISEHAGQESRGRPGNRSGSSRAPRGRRSAR